MYNLSETEMQNSQTQSSQRSFDDPDQHLQMVKSVIAKLGINNDVPYKLVKDQCVGDEVLKPPAVRPEKPRENATTVALEVPKCVSWIPPERKTGHKRFRSDSRSRSPSRGSGIAEELDAPAPVSFAPDESYAICAPVVSVEDGHFVYQLDDRDEEWCTMHGVEEEVYQNFFTRLERRYAEMLITEHSKESLVGRNFGVPPDRLVETAQRPTRCNTCSMSLNDRKTFMCKGCNIVAHADCWIFNTEEQEYCSFCLDQNSQPSSSSQTGTRSSRRQNATAVAETKCIGCSLSFSDLPLLVCAPAGPESPGLLMMTKSPIYMKAHHNNCQINKDELPTARKKAATTNGNGHNNKQHPPKDDASDADEECFDCAPKSTHCVDLKASHPPPTDPNAKYFMHQICAELYGLNQVCAIDRNTLQVTVARFSVDSMLRETCGICHRNGGIKAACRVSSCYNYFHPSCAAHAFQTDVRPAVQKKRKKEERLTRGFCRNHLYIRDHDWAKRGASTAPDDDRPTPDEDNPTLEMVSDRCVGLAKRAVLEENDNAAPHSAATTSGGDDGYVDKRYAYSPFADSLAAAWYQKRQTRRKDVKKLLVEVTKGLEQMVVATSAELIRHKGKLILSSVQSLIPSLQLYLSKALESTLWLDVCVTRSMVPEARAPNAAEEELGWNPAAEEVRRALDAHDAGRLRQEMQHVAKSVNVLVEAANHILCREEDLQEYLDLTSKILMRSGDSALYEEAA